MYLESEGGLFTLGGLASIDRFSSESERGVTKAHNVSRYSSETLPLLNSCRVGTFAPHFAPPVSSHPHTRSGVVSQSQILTEDDSRS